MNRSQKFPNVARESSVTFLTALVIFLGARDLTGWMQTLWEGLAVWYLFMAFLEHRNERRYDDIERMEQDYQRRLDAMSNMADEIDRQRRMR
jgi:hypothetical protein